MTTDESTALVAVRMRQQEKTLDAALKQGRIALRAETKAKREALKEANKQLSIALKISIEESDKSITEQFKQDAVALAQDDRLAGRIAATDVGL